MNKIKFLITKMCLSLLAILPIPSVAFAAQNTLTDLEGQYLKDRHLLDLLKLKTQVFKPFQTHTTLDLAYLYFKIKNQDLEPEELNHEFQNLVKILIDSGFVKINEKEIIAIAPSRMG